MMSEIFAVADMDRPILRGAAELRAFRWNRGENFGVIDRWITLLAGVIDIARIIGRVYSSTLNRGVLGFARSVI